MTFAEFLGGVRRSAKCLSVLVALGAGVGSAPVFMSPAVAQNFTVTNIEISSNQRIDDASILSFLALPRGQAVTGGQINDGLQRLQGSGLFESVDIVPAGNTLVVTVKEFPTINRVNIEGNERLKDEDLLPLLQSQSRRVYNPATAEADAAILTEGYRQSGRIAATVTPRIIPRSNNRVDVVFEVTEGRVAEVERISFTGNRAFSDRRLRRVVGSKQAGVFRLIVQSDTFINDRIAFDRQLLRDFYLSRGYVDFQVLAATPELTRQRDAFFITFQVQEGQQFRFGEITASSDLPEIDVDEFLATNKIKTGKVYSPARVENTITRMERLAIQQGLDFIRVEPRINRNDADMTLDVEFAITRGPRVFVERIDIEGNATTLDRVIRRQFDTVEGDPFNPREIRDAAERIRALGFFSEADVRNISLSFSEPSLLGRDLRAGFDLFQRTTDAEFADFDTENIGFEPSIDFPISENGRLRLTYQLSRDTISDVQPTVSPIIQRDAGDAITSALGYQYSYDTRRTGLNPTSGVLLRFAQRYAGIGGDQQYINTTGLVSAETRVAREEVTLRAEFEFGAQMQLDGNSRITERFFLGSRRMRGFEGDGIGPRDLGTPGQDALGGNYFAVARMEAEFPLGLPEEYGITGGAFLDVGSLWGLDDTNGAAEVDDGFNLRAVVGVSVFWNTQIGPLRFNFSRALVREEFDRERNFDLTVSTRF